MWPETATSEEAKATQLKFKTKQLPIMEKLVGKNSGAYINEADFLEDDRVGVFYGSQAKYNRLLKVKKTYDPKDLFIVAAGVGSERWDSYGLCRV
jgi:phage terminase large subunit